MKRNHFNGYKKVRQSTHGLYKRMVNTYEYLIETGTTHKMALYKMSKMKYIDMKTTSIGVVLSKNNNLRSFI